MKIKIPDTMKKLYVNGERRELVMRFNGGKEPTLYDYNTVHRFLKALAQTVGSRRKTVLRGLGVFEWRPWKGRTPTVESGRSWRLSFALTRAERNYKGRRK